MRIDEAVEIQWPPKDHPPGGILERFMRGGLPRPQARTVVRHLLTGCSQCTQITGRLWTIGDLPPLPPPPKGKEEEVLWARWLVVTFLKAEGGKPYMKPTADARAQLLEIERQLEAIRFRLLGVQASLPPAPSEIVPLLEEENMQAAAQIRAVIQCVLQDSIEPAIQDLREVAKLPEGRQ